MGAGRQTKGRGGRRPTRQAPPSGTTAAGIARAARVQPRGCKGRSPLHEITLVSPFPPGRGLGGWGQKSKLKARQAGNKEGKPPFGHHSDRDSPRRHARAQAKAGTGHERRLPPIIIRSRKVLGGVGDSFKSPPAHPRIPASPYPRILASPFPIPPVRHGDGGRGCRSRRSGRLRGGGRRRRRPRGQRRGGRGTGRSRPCRRG